MAQFRPGFVPFLAASVLSALSQAVLDSDASNMYLQAVTYLLIAVTVVDLYLRQRLHVPATVAIPFVFVIIYSQIVAISGSIASGAPIAREQLLIPAALVLIGSSMSLGPREIRILAYLFGGSTAIAIWIVNLRFNPSLSIPEQYFFVEKNKLGAVVGAGVALLLYQLVRDLYARPVKGRYVTLSAALIVANVFPLLLVRNRSTITGLIVLLLLVSAKVIGSGKKGRPGKVALGVLAVVLVANAAEVAGQVIEAYTLNFDVADIDSLTADRTTTYRESLFFISDNLLFGELGNVGNQLDPHNFLLYQLQKYGILGGGGYLALYAMFAWRLVAVWVRYPIANIPAWAYLLVISYISSVFEYAQPFGPGSTQLIAWMLVGSYFGNSRAVGGRIRASQTTVANGTARNVDPA